MTAPMKPIGFTLAARAVGLLASCAGGPSPSITIYLKRDLGPSGPPDQIAPVLAPAKRLVEQGVPCPMRSSPAHGGSYEAARRKVKRLG